MTKRRRPSATPVIAGSIAAFMGLFGFLTYELGTGHDPALSHRARAALAPAPKRVVVRRLEHRIIVTKVVHDDEDDAPVVATSAPAVASAPAQASTPAVVVQQPAPAPQPAPVVTRSS
jgi:hypothetical protein